MIGLPAAGPSREAVCRTFAPCDDSGQATVEYAVVVAAFLSVVVALGAFGRILGGGLFVEHAVASASHHVAGATAAIIDVFSF